MRSTSLLITCLLVVGASASPAQTPKPFPNWPPCCSNFEPAPSYHNESRHCKMGVSILKAGTPEFKERNKSFFTAFNNDITPSKIACPDSAEEVSQLVREASRCNGEIGVRGGGHTPWKGAANLDGHLVIDMRNLTGVIVNADKNIVSIRAGERWGNVYEKLASKGLATVGGRVSRVGVSGLTLGGESCCKIDISNGTHRYRRFILLLRTLWFRLRRCIKFRGRPCFRENRQCKQIQQSRSLRRTERR